MPVFTFVLEQAVQLKFGAVGAGAFLMLTIGIRVRNSTCAGIGAVVLALLFMQPGMG